MSTAASVIGQLQELLDKANAKTGVSDTTLTAAVDRLIAGYGTGGEAECEHAEVTATYMYNGNGTHTVTNTCTACGETVSTQTVSCTMSETVEDNGNGTHTVTNTCSVCGGVVEETADCADGDGDGKCDVCGAELSCSHTTFSVSHKSNGDGTHTTTRTCSECKEVISTTVEDCGDYDDGNGVCSVCGGTIPCSHASQSTGWTYNEDGTHTKRVICSECKELISETVENCTDDDGDGKCDVCQGTLEEDTAVWSYETGELSGLYGYMAYVQNSKLVCAESSAYGYHVACGAVNGTESSLVSNKTIRPIPVPKTATKMTITAGDTKTTGVKAWFIKGTPSSVENCEGTLSGNGDAVENNICTFDFSAGEWDYVIFNFVGSWSSTVTAPYAGTKAILVFE